MVVDPGIEWYVYLVCCADKSLYCGVSPDPVRRTRQHNGGAGAGYTRSRRPVKLMWFEGGHTHGSALRREAVIKKLSRAAKEKLVKGG